METRRILFGILGVLVVASCVLRADATGFMIGTDMRVNQRTFSTQIYSDICSIGGNGYAIAWQTYESGGDYDIGLTAFDSSNNRIFNEITANNYIRSTQRFPRIASTSSGGTLVTWDTYRNSWDICARFFDSNGAPLAGEFVVHGTGTTGSQLTPAVTALDSSTFLIVYTSSFGTGPDRYGYGIYGQRVQAPNVLVGTNFTMNSFVSNSQDDPDVTTLSDGSVAIVFMSNGFASSTYGVATRVFSSSMSPITNDILVNDASGNYNQKPHVAALTGGGYAVCFSSYSSVGDNDWGIKLRIFENSGSARTGVIIANTFTAGSQLDCGVVGVESGSVLVTWRTVFRGQGAWAIAGQYFSPNGEKEGIEFRMNSATQMTTLYGRGASLPNGNVAMTWTEEFGLSGYEIGSRIVQNSDVTITPTYSSTPSRTMSHSLSNSVSISRSKTVTRSMSTTDTVTRSYSRTRTGTASISKSPTTSRSNTITRTQTKSVSTSYTISVSYSRSPSMSETASRTSSASRTSTGSNRPTRSNSPSQRFSMSPSRSPSVTPSETRTSTRTRSLSRTASSTYTFSHSETRTQSKSMTTTQSISETRTTTRSGTVTVSDSRTMSRSISKSHTETLSTSFSRTYTQSNTASFTFTRSTSQTRTNTPSSSRSISFTRSISHSSTPSRTPFPSRSVSRSPTISKSGTRTLSRSRTASTSVIVAASASGSQSGSASLTPTPSKFWNLYNPYRNGPLVIRITNFDESIGYWPLNDLPSGSGQTVNTKEVTLPGVVFGEDYGAVTGTEPELDTVGGRAVDIGTGGSVVIPFGKYWDTIVTSGGSLEFWVRIDASSSTPRMVAMLTDLPGENCDGFFEVWVTGNDFQVVVAGESLESRGGTISFGSTFANWVFVAVAFEDVGSGSIRATLFVDAVQHDVATVSSAAVMNSQCGVSFGPYGAGWHQHSYDRLKIDEVAVFGGSVTSLSLRRRSVIGHKGGCVGDPCYSGVLCTPLGLNTFSCGSCPTDYTGDGRTCTPNSGARGGGGICQPPSYALTDGTYCSINCATRTACMMCSMSYTGKLLWNVRASCNYV